MGKLGQPTATPETQTEQVMNGIRHIYTLQDGEDFRFFSNGPIVVVHPDRPPKIINADGTVDVLRGQTPETQNPPQP